MDWRIETQVLNNIIKAGYWNCRILGTEREEKERMETKYQEIDVDLILCNVLTKSLWVSKI